MRLFTFIAMLFFSTNLLYAQIIIQDTIVTKKGKNKKKTDLPPEPNTFNLEINHDNMFGFHPKFKGSIGYDFNKSYTFYAVLWNNPVFAPITTSTTKSNDQWLEIGIGGSMSLFKRTLTINPALGIVNGKFLNGQTAYLVEGVTPSMNVKFDNKSFEFEAQGNGFFTLRTQNDANDFFMVRISPGIVINKTISIGGHFEDFQKIHPNPQNQFQWVGGYMKINFSEKNHMKFIAGTNFNNNRLYSKELYRFSAGMSF
jgi:hypothetical protein